MLKFNLNLNCIYPHLIANFVDKPNHAYQINFSYRKAAKTV